MTATEYSFGPLIEEDGVLFRIWAPFCDRVCLVVGEGPPQEMDVRPDGWFHLKVQDAAAGTLYRFQLADGLLVPDAASRHQPDDTFGPSEVVDLAPFASRDTVWRGRPWRDTVLYELHVGTFTSEGTFRAAIERLDHLAHIGVTAIQLMPIADFPGRWNWGYDGTFPYAPDSRYGRPEDLSALVEGAHRRGISVFLDLVYNHFGPSGNFFPAYAPLFSPHHQTAWGDGVNLDDDQSAPVREFLVQNALHWIEFYKIDGLRFDAVHAIQDDSDRHFLEELALRIRRQFPERYVHLIVENEDNNPTLLRRDGDLRSVLYDAQWNDDVHHALHVATTGETFGYYGDYADFIGALAQSLAEGFAYQGEVMAYRGERRGAPSNHLPPTAFLSFLQNHDHVGNRANGDRVMSSIPEPALAFAVSLILLSPQVPMLFMGEEWCSKRPFPYFCDFDETLNASVRAGRREELSQLPGFDSEHVVDPTAEETYRSAILDWEEAKSQAGSIWVERYRILIDLRRNRVVPMLPNMTKGGTYSVDQGIVRVEWPVGDSQYYVLVANPSAEFVAVEKETDLLEVVYALGEHRPDGIGAWSLVFGLRDIQA